MVEEISRSLQRYYDKREEINEKQKKYFRDVYYYKNREKLVDYQRIRRQMGGVYPRCASHLMVTNPVITTHNVIIEKNCLVKF